MSGIFLFQKIFTFTIKTKKMAASGTVTQSLDGKTLTFVDTSSGLPTITSRILSIYSPTNVLLDTINMGASLTATYAITQDGWFRFSLSLNSGAYTTIVDYLAQNFYYTGLINKSRTDCGCSSNNSLCSDVAKAMMADKAAVFYTTYGFAANADTSIKAADALIL